MSWNLQSQTKTDLLTAASDAKTAVESLATAVGEFKTAMATATLEISSQGVAHLGDAALSIGWTRFIDWFRGAMISNGLAPILSGDPGDYVKEQMGHHSIQVTDIYGHLIPGTNRKAVDRLDDRSSESSTMPKPKRRKALAQPAATPRNQRDPCGWRPFLNS